MTIQVELTLSKLGFLRSFGTRDENPNLYYNYVVITTKLIRD